MSLQNLYKAKFLNLAEIKNLSDLLLSIRSWIKLDFLKIPAEFLSIYVLGLDNIFRAKTLTYL